MEMAAEERVEEEKVEATGEVETAAAREEAMAGRRGRRRRRWR